MLKSVHEKILMNLISLNFGIMKLNMWLSDKVFLALISTVIDMVLELLNMEI